MLEGREYWDHSITRDMHTVDARGRVVEVFRDAPASLYSSLMASADRSPDAIALVTDGGEEITFRALRERTDRFAAELAQLISAGERIALLLDTSVEFAVALYAANRCGAIVVPIPTKHKEPEVEALLTMSGVRLAIVEERFSTMGCMSEVETVIAVRSHEISLGAARGTAAPEGDVPRADPDADCILMYTSGTTARSKGVLLTNRNVGHAIVAYQRILDLGPNDSSIVPIPIYHITGMVALLALFVHIGGRLHLHRRFDADRVLATVRDNDISFLHGSPTVFALLLARSQHYPQLPSLRAVACGAAHMPVSRIAEFHAWLPHAAFRTVYGLTETTSPGLIFPGDAATSEYVGSSGCPIPGMRVVILDDDGREVGPGIRGEIWLYGTNLLRCYDGMVTDALSPDGWLNTGDIGYANADGYVFIVDRVKDMINRGGEKVWCIDVEEELRRIPGVADAAVVGVPHEVYGEEPAAVVLAQRGAALLDGEIRAALEQRLAKFQVPRHIRIVDEIPMTANLKVNKRAIRALFQGSGVRE